MLEYKGYTGRVEFDDEAMVLHGEVIGLRDVVTFQGTSVEELEEAFRDSVDDYLEFCAERGEEPDKQFSGRLLLRLTPELHRDAYVCANHEGKSLNQWIAEVLEGAARGEASPHSGRGLPSADLAGYECSGHYGVITGIVTGSKQKTPRAFVDDEAEISRQIRAKFEELYGAQGIALPLVIDCRNTEESSVEREEA